MWFGTDKGLARFDGSRFQVFGVNEGLPDPEVLGLYEDSRKRLWISCFSRKLCYMQDGVFITAAQDTMLERISAGSAFMTFHEDPDHKLWFFSGSRAIFTFDGQRYEEKIFPQTSAGITRIGDKNIFLGTGNLWQEGQSDIYEIDPSSPFTFVSIVASGNQFLCAYQKSLILIEWDGKRFFQKDKLQQQSGHVFKDREEHFWVSGALGIRKFGKTHAGLSRSVQFLPDKKINAMFEDHHGNLWFCTDGDGIYTCSPDKAATFTRAEGLQMNNITALEYNPGGYLIAGDNVGNLYKINQRIISLLTANLADSPNRCRQIITQPDDDWWALTEKYILYGSGAVVRKGVTENRTLGSLKTVLAQPDRLWFGSHSLLGYFPLPSKTPVILHKRRTTTLGADTDGNIWAGGVEGIYNEHDTFNYNWAERFPALKGRIVTIRAAGAGQLWIVSAESGLLLADVSQHTITRLQVINSYLKNPIENIQSLFIESGPVKRIWLATNTGVYGIHPADWSIIHYDSKDGLANNDVNSVLAVNDTLWVGTVSGLSCLPLKKQDAQKEFRTYVTELRYHSGGQTYVLNLLDSLSDTHQLFLPANAALATLQFAGLEYGSRGKLQYEYVLKTIMPPLRWWTRHDLIHWVGNRFQQKSDTTRTNQNNLNFGITIPNGSFQIQVTAVNSQGIYSTSPDRWTLTVIPRWYSTIWFELLIWLCILYIIRRIYQAREGYRKLNVAVSQLQLQALQSQINPHFVGNSINAIQQFFYPPNPGQASHYIELFTRLLRRTIFLSEKHFNRFEEELAYDADYLQMIKLRFGERFEYEVRGAENIPANLPFPSMLLQPVLENATIHGLAPEGISHLCLAFTYTGRKMTCTVTDNGMGIHTARMRRPLSLKEHTSKGIELLKRKVEAFNELYHLDLELTWTDLSETSPPGQGTQVEVRFYPEKMKEPSNGRLFKTVNKSLKTNHL